MAEIYRSSVFAVKEETTADTLIAPVAADFVPIREGFVFQGNVETVDSDEMINDIGKSKSFVGKEAPSGSLPKYFRHSGTEGQAPEYSVMIKSAMGTQTTNATEYSVTSGSVAGTSTTRGSLEMASNDEDNFIQGQGLLIKDATNGYSIRNVYNVDSTGNQLDLNFNLSSAPASGVALGKAIHFSPSASGHVTYSAYHYQASASTSAFYQAMAGCRTTSMTMNFPANGLAEINFDFEGTKFYFNPITITASTNDAIDFNSSAAGEVNATLTAKVYNNPHELAREIQTKMDALTGDTITCTYSDTTGKFTITGDGSSLSILWLTGTNNAASVDTTIGFTHADDTGALTYTSDNAITFNPSVTPSYDTQDSIPVRSSNLLIGGYNDITCRTAGDCSFTIATPKTDVLSICASNGIDSSIINERTATFSGSLVLSKYDAGLFDKFINNTTSSIMFNTGTKSAGNWVAGTCVNVYMDNASITAHPITEVDGYVTIALEASGFVDTSHKDIHINFL